MGSVAVTTAIVIVVSVVVSMMVSVFLIFEVSMNVVNICYFTNGADGFLIQKLSRTPTLALHICMQVQTKLNKLISPWIICISMITIEWWCIVSRYIGGTDEEISRNYQQTEERGKKDSFSVSHDILVSMYHPLCMQNGLIVLYL